MEITWDDKKEAANIEKHGVDFAEAQSVVTSPLSLYRLNPHVSDARFEYIGYSMFDRILLVVTVEETEDEIRILSAREATQNEKSEYQG